MLAFSSFGIPERQAHSPRVNEPLENPFGLRVLPISLVRCVAHVSGLDRFRVGPKEVGGREGIRTPDPLLAKQVLSQLSYTPTVGLLLILKHLPPF